MVTWNQVITCKLSVLDRNTWNHIILQIGCIKIIWIYNCIQTITTNTDNFQVIIWFQETIPIQLN